LLTASAVLVDQDGIVVGKEAVKASMLAPDTYAECFKRDMGSACYRHKLRGIETPPEVLSAFVLERLRRDAEQRLGPIKQAVITVPAFFDETRRKATQEAGRLAGLEVLDIINEPTAAALAFGYQHGFLDRIREADAGHPMRVMVYDLGGGTFDVTILELHGLRFRVLATDGDVCLGGKDFDERLVNSLAEKFAATHGVDPRSDPQDAAQLWLDAQEAKHALSERSRTTVALGYAGLRMRAELTRGEFEELTRDLLERTETTTSLLVKEAGLDWAQVDRVLLVGGSTRMPMVGDMLRRVTGKEPDRTVSPDEVVAHGAALYAAMLRDQGGTSALSQCQLINVNSHSLGIVGLDPATRRRTNVILIRKNTPLPCQATRVFHTAKADQRSVKVAVVEGESHRPEDCIALGECVVRDLPAGLPKGASIQVQYRYAANGRISVTARVAQARQWAQVDIERGQKRDLKTLDYWRSRLLGLATGDASSTATPDALPPVNIKDHASVVRRLDALYTAVGRAAVKLTLPSGLTRAQQAARQAAAQLATAHERLTTANSALQAAVSQSEKIHARAEVVRAQTDVELARKQHEFTHLVLGRDCVSADQLVSGAESRITEIREVRLHLEAMG
jgi:molecular chaperone DnaK